MPEADIVFDNSTQHDWECTCRSKKHLQNTEILQAALAEEEAETTPDALEQGTHVAAGPPQWPKYMCQTWKLPMMSPGNQI